MENQVTLLCPIEELRGHQMIHDVVWNYVQADDPLLTCPVCRAAVAWSDKDDHLKWHSTTQQEC